MEGSSPKTGDRWTRITSTTSALSHTHTGQFCEHKGHSERTATLRAKLITATIEVIAEGSAPRLVKTLGTNTGA